MISFVALAIAAAGSPAVAQSQTAAPAAPGSTRIAWDQTNGPLAIQSFDVFIDGVASPLSTVSCEAGASASTCSARLPLLSPGDHSVSVVAIDAAGIPSAPSSPLSVSIARTVEIRGAAGDPGLERADVRSSANTAARTDVATKDAVAAAESDSRVCGGDACFSVSVVAHGNGAIERIVPLTDGRSLLVRGQREVLALGARGVEYVYVLQSPSDSTATIADIAVAPTFERDHLVFLAVVLRTDQDSSARVRVVRLREAGGTLSDPTSVLPDMPLHGDGSPALVADANGRVFLSMPGRAADAGDGVDSAILAFTAQGAAAGRARGSMVFARGVERPGALAIASDRLYVTTADQSPSSTMQSIALASAEPRGITMIAPAGDGAAGIHSVAFTGALRGMLVTESPRALFTFDLSQDARALIVSPISLGARQPRAVAATSDGSVLVSVIDAADQSSATVLRLRPEGLTTAIGSR